MRRVRLLVEITAFTLELQADVFGRSFWGFRGMASQGFRETPRKIATDAHGDAFITKTQVINSERLDLRKIESILNVHIH